MRWYLMILFLWANASMAGTNYYFSNAGNDGGACSLGSPCQTISKANTIGVAGDTVRFNGGNSWTEVLRPRTGVYYSTYGAGKAIITGMTTLSGWSSLGGGIYQTTFAGNSNSNLLLMNGIQQPMARFPNTGYLQYQSFSTTTSITSSSLTGTPNWTNGYLALRNNNFTLSYNLITSQSGSTINYTAGTSQNGTNNFGFFVINDSLALDTLGEWFYSIGTGKMKMYFGGSTPSSFTVQSPTIDTLINIQNGLKNITIDNFDIEGANLYGIYVGTDTNVVIKNCTIKYVGGIGVCKNAAVNSSVINSYIQYCNDNGIMVLGNSVGEYVGYDTLRNIGTIPGQGRLLQGNNYKGITQDGLGGITEYCRTDTTGYTAIMGYNDSAIHKNAIDYFCFVIDDGGGVYHLGYTDSTKTHIIDSNIISNGIGAPAGTALGTGYKPANGVYLDNNNFGITVNGNVVSNCAENGLFVHNTRSCTLTNNTVYNCHYQIQFQGDASAYPIKNNIVKYNIFGIAASTQSVCRMSLFNAIPSFYKTCGIIDSNYYAYSSISSNPFTIFPSTSLTYQGWQDSTADVRAFTFAAPVDFKSNGTATPISYQLSKNCVNNLNTKFYNSATIPPYTGLLFLQGSYYVIPRGVRPSFH